MKEKCEAGAVNATASRRAVIGGLASAAAVAVTPAAAWPALPQLAAREPIGIQVAADLDVAAVDMHSHAGGGISRASSGHYDVAKRMQQGSFDVVTLSLIADLPVLRREGIRTSAVRKPGPGELYKHVTEQLAVVHDMIAKQKFIHVLTPADVEAAKTQKRPGLIIAVEGADFLEGKIDRLKWAHGRGVRHVQLVHYRVNELGDIQTEDPVHNGLTAFGADVVRECNRLGMIVDVAHASLATTAKAAEVSKAPLLMSHGGISPQSRPKSRMMSPDHARIVVQSGGVIGLWPNGFIFPKMSVWLDYVARIAERIGMDHIGIGTDMEGGIKEVFRNYTQFPEVVDGLMSRGFSKADVGKFAGGNHMRVFKAVAAATTA